MGKYDSLTKADLINKLAKRRASGKGPLLSLGLNNTALLLAAINEGFINLDYMGFPLLNSIATKTRQDYHPLVSKVPKGMMRASALALTGMTMRKGTNKAHMNPNIIHIKGLVKIDFF